MSDVLSAAAAALGLPEALVQRSAAARATETGSSVDDILAAWAGGAPPPAPTAPASETPVEEPAETVAAAPTSQPATPEIVVPAPPQPVASAPIGPYKPPVLVGGRDNPATIMLGSIALFLIVLLVGLVGPSIPIDEAGARSSELDYSQLALDGRQIYASQGCQACHTQMVRPVVADVGLGLVTLNDSNQMIGTRRFGPDLSDVGNRYEPADLEAVVSGDVAGHPPYQLADEHMAAVVAYLSESRTSG